MNTKDEKDLLLRMINPRMVIEEQLNLICTNICKRLPAKDVHIAKEYFESERFLEFISNRPIIEKLSHSNWDDLSYEEQADALKDIYEALPDDFPNVLKKDLEFDIKHKMVIARQSKYPLTKFIEALPGYTELLVRIIFALTLLYLCYGVVKHYIFDGTFSFSTPLFLLGSCVVVFIVNLILAIIIGKALERIAYFVAKSEK